MIYDSLVPLSIRGEFINKVNQVSDYLGVRPEWLMQVMKAESGVNPKAKNIQNGRIVAVGLIQFTSPTAIGLGTTQDILLSMNHIQQMDYVQKYYKPWRNKMKDYFDVYLATFFPLAIGKPDNWVFQTSKQSAALIAQQNPAININKDGQITMAEFKKYVKSTVPIEYQSIMFKKKA